MKTLDHDAETQILDRLQRLALDKKPEWGSLTPAGMVRHLTDSLRISMGRGPTAEDTSSWFSRRIVAPLIIRRIVPMPKNVKAPIPMAPSRNTSALSSEIETLHAVLDDYLKLVQTGELEPAPHPYFGGIGIDGWAKLHCIHIDHHLRQFGV